MAAIANLAVSLTARTEKFRKGMRGAGKTVTRFAKSVTSATSRVLAFGGALIGVAAAGGFAYMIRQSMQAIDTLAKVSDKLGLATEKMAGLEYSAKLSGIAITKLHMALQRMTRRIAEAAVGKGEALEALKTLGIDPVTLSAKTADEQFYALADALEAVKSQSQRLRLAFKLFDSEGAELILMARGASAALAAQQKEAERLGVAISRIDAAMIEAANKAIDRLTTAIQGARDSIAVELAPYIETAVNEVVELGLAGRITGDTIVNAMEKAAIAVAKLGGTMEAAKVTTHGLRSGLAAFLSVKFKQLPFQWAKDYSLALMETALEAGKAANTAADEFVKREKDIEAWFVKLRAGAAEAAKAIAEQALLDREAAMATIAAMRAETERLALVKKLETAASRVYEQTRTPLEKYRSQMEELNTLLHQGLVNWDTYGRAAKAAAEKTQEAFKLEQKRSRVTFGGQISSAVAHRVSIEALGRGAKRQQEVYDKEAVAELKSIKQELRQTREEKQVAVTS